MYQDRSLWVRSDTPAGAYSVTIKASLNGNVGISKTIAIAVLEVCEETGCDTAEISFTTAPGNMSTSLNGGLTTQ